MITIFHGEDIVSSRKSYLEQRQKTPSPTVLDGKTVTLTDIIESFEGMLFADINIFIEDLLSRKKSQELDEVIDYLAKNQLQKNIYFWEGKEISAKTVSLFPGAKILTFKLPQMLFAFLDALKPGNGNNLLLLFHNASKNLELELIFYMIVRQFRILLAISDNKSSSVIDELARLMPWQKDKLRRQTSLFSQEQLKNIYNKLYKIDLNQKTGQTSLSLTQNVDMLLLDI